MIVLTWLKVYFEIPAFFLKTRKWHAHGKTAIRFVRNVLRFSSGYVAWTGGRIYGLSMEIRSILLIPCFEISVRFPSSSAVNPSLYTTPSNLSPSSLLESLNLPSCHLPATFCATEETNSRLKSLALISSLRTFHLISDPST